jgi:hypothetical protein
MMTNSPNSRPKGNFSLRAFRPPQRPSIRNMDDAVAYGTPQRASFWDRAAAARRAWQAFNLSENFTRSLADQAAFDAGRLFAIGHLWLGVQRRDGRFEDLGLVSCRVVTDTGVGYIVDAFQNLVEAENMRYHGLGTGSTAEAASQTALITELTTQYSTSNTRPTGTLGEKAGDAKTFETTATITVSTTVAATEHGIFSQAATGGGVMLDRSVFSVVNLASSESIAATYQITFPSGL